MKQLTELEVNVDDEAIRTGNRKAKCSCPVARAINRTLSEDSKIEMTSVDIKDGHFSHSLRENSRWIKNLYKFELPEEAKAFVAKWENGETPGPIQFAIHPKFIRDHTGVMGTI